METTDLNSYSIEVARGKNDIFKIYYLEDAHPSLYARIHKPVIFNTTTPEVVQ